MRISTLQFQTQATNALAEDQSRLATTQLQLATGRAILSPSDDPAGSKRILDFEQTVSLADQYVANAEAAQTRLDFSETVLESVTTEITRVRELALRTMNGSLTDTDRRGIASEVRERLDQLLALANSKDSNNDYLFSGSMTGTEPFARNASGGFDYNGDQGQRFIQVNKANQVAVGDSGADVFMLIRNGNGTFRTDANAANTGTGAIGPGTVIDSTLWDNDNHTITFSTNANGQLQYSVSDSGGVIVPNTLYTEGDSISFKGVQVTIDGTPAAGDSFTVQQSINQDLFTTVQNLAQHLDVAQPTPASRAQFENDMSSFLADLDQGLENILGSRAQLGARLNAVESEININEDFKLFAETNLSDVQDLDYVEASARLQLQLLTFQAAQQSFALVQRLSLFEFL